MRGRKRAGFVVEGSRPMTQSHKSRAIAARATRASGPPQPQRRVQAQTPQHRSLSLRFPLAISAVSFISSQSCDNSIDWTTSIEFPAFRSWQRARGVNWRREASDKRCGKGKENQNAGEPCAAAAGDGWIRCRPPLSTPPATPQPQPCNLSTTTDTVATSAQTEGRCTTRK